MAVSGNENYIMSLELYQQMSRVIGWCDINGNTYPEYICNRFKGRANLTKDVKEKLDAAKNQGEMWDILDEAKIEWTNGYDTDDE